MKSSKNTIRIISGICFSILFVLSFWDFYAMYGNFFFSGWAGNYLYILGIPPQLWAWAVRLSLLLLAAGLFVNVSALCAAGCVVSLIESILYLILSLRIKPYVVSTVEYLLTFERHMILTFIFFALLLASCILKGRSRKIIALLACLVPILSSIIYISYLTKGNLNAQQIALIILQRLLLVIGAIMTGFGLVKKPSVAKETSKADDQITTSTKIEKLTRLKTLLDTGVISQEEFEKKKSELIDKW